MNDALSQRLRDRQKVLRAKGLERSLSVRSATSQVLDLAGNDYLGLSRDPVVVKAAVDATERWGAGATGSRLVTGSTDLHQELELAIAESLGAESALVFSSGYLANLGVVTALCDPGTLVLVDAHAHASLVDAARLSRGQFVTVPHNDVPHVSAALSRRHQPRAMVVTESVFSVDGDSAPLQALSEACAAHGATLLVDEAHAIGTAGDGLGLVHQMGMAGRSHVVVTGTLSKALGSQGGFVAAPAEVRNFLITRARPFVYDTALAPAATAAAAAALQILVGEPHRIGRLREVVAVLSACVGVKAPQGAVLAVPMPSPQQAVEAAQRAAREGVLIGAFRPPSVPDDRSRLRITARADLDDEQISAACKVLSDVLSGL